MLNSHPGPVHWQACLMRGSHHLPRLVQACKTTKVVYYARSVPQANHKTPHTARRMPHRDAARCTRRTRYSQSPLHTCSAANPTYRPTSNPTLVNPSTRTRTKIPGRPAAAATAGGDSQTKAESAVQKVRTQPCRQMDSVKLVSHPDGAHAALLKVPPRPLKMLNCHSKQVC